MDSFIDVSFAINMRITGRNRTDAAIERESLSDHYLFFFLLIFFTCFSFGIRIIRVTSLAFAFLVLFLILHYRYPAAVFFELDFAAVCRRVPTNLQRSASDTTVHRLTLGDSRTSPN